MGYVRDDDKKHPLVFHSIEAVDQIADRPLTVLQLVPDDYCRMMSHREERGD